MQPRRDVVHGRAPGLAPVVVCVMLVVASALQAGSGSVGALDRGVRRWCLTHHDSRVFEVLDALTRLADWRWVCASLVVLACAAALAQGSLRPVRQSLLAVLFLVVVTGVLKATFGRPGPTGVTPPNLDGAWPSGHALALVVTTVMILRLFPASRERRRWKAVAFLPAVALGAALVYCQHHWFTDVAVAFPLGLLLGWASLASEGRIGSRIAQAHSDDRGSAS